MLWGNRVILPRCDVAFLWASKVSANQGAMPKSASVDTSFQVSKIQYIREPISLMHLGMFIVHICNTLLLGLALKNW